MDWETELVQRAKLDAHYQEMLEEVKKREMKFLDVWHILSAEQQKVLDDYIASCEELDHILTKIAYTLGKDQSKKNIRLV